jgi:hypothetical protein
MSENTGSNDACLDTLFDFTDTYHYEKDQFYWYGLKGPDETDRWLMSTYIWGGSQGNFTLNLTGVIDDPTYQAKVRLALRGIYDISLAPLHHALIYLNGNLIEDVQWTDTFEKFIETTVPQPYLVDGNNVITVKAVLEGGAAFDLILTDWIEIDYLRDLDATNNTLKFNSNNTDICAFEITGFTAQPELYDITDPENVKYLTNFTYSGGTLTFKDDISSRKEYISAGRANMKKPAAIETDVPSSLGNTSNQADYIIITAADFYDAVQPLVEHREKGKLTSKVVKVQDIYDEFNGGIQSPHAIKDFLKYTYKYWQKPAPTYVLLVGDASYDYRDNYGYGRSNYVPTFMIWAPYMGETGSDNWFVLMDGENDRLGDMFIGRIPARTSAEVSTVVDKTINYEKKSCILIPMLMYKL